MNRRSSSYVAPACAGVIQATDSILDGHKIGAAVESGAIAGAEAEAFSEVGANTGLGQARFGSAHYFENVAGHALVGGTFSVIRGGSFQSGALAAGFSASVSPYLPHDAIEGTAASAVIGGTASVLGGRKFGNGAETGAFGYLFNELAYRGEKLWATQPTADEYAAHYADGTGETVYREGSDVNLGEYPSGQFDAPAGSVIALYPSSVSLGAALLNWEAGTLQPGALTDTFLYGSLGVVTVLGVGPVQLGPDTFNFNMESGRPFRNWMTQLQHNTPGGGLPGKDFQTIFVGPTKAP